MKKACFLFLFLLSACTSSPKVVLVPSKVALPHPVIPEAAHLFVKDLKDSDKLKPDIVMKYYVTDLKNCRHENKVLRMELEAYDE